MRDLHFLFDFIRTERKPASVLFITFLFSILRICNINGAHKRTQNENSCARRQFSEATLHYLRGG